VASERYLRDAAHGGPSGRPVDLPAEPAPSGPIGGRRGAQEGPISERVGRDPGNLGDEIPDSGDAVHPSPDVGSGDDLGAGQM